VQEQLGEQEMQTIKNIKKGTPKGSKKKGF